MPRYSDVLLAFSQLTKPIDHLYQELQFALREAVGTRTLDELLEDKQVIDDVVSEQVKSRMLPFGMEIASLGYGVFEGEGAGTLASTRPFWSGDAHVIPMITGATILCFSFTGFDGISNLSEETKDAERVIPRAIFLTALIGGMIFIISTSGQRGTKTNGELP